MNKLIVPKTTFVEKIKSVFLNYQKRALLSYWWVTSILLGIVSAIGIFLFVSIIEGGAQDYLIFYALLAGIGWCALDLKIIEISRKRIIADMKHATPLRIDSYILHNSDNSAGEHITYVHTMAGELKFIGGNRFLYIVKKTGKLFDYYEFLGVKGLNKKYLRKFIAVKSDLDL